MNAKRVPFLWSGMFDTGRRFVFLCILSFLPVQTGNAGEKIEKKTVFREEFRTLEDWKPYEFKSINKHTDYTVVTKEGRPLLKMESNSSASGIVQKKTFRVYDFPILKWRWKTENVYTKGNEMQKDGDDYPLRLYVLFQYEKPEGFSLRKLTFDFVKGLYGEYPPDSAISYVWSSHSRTQEPYPAPGSQNVLMFPLDSGNGNVGNWREHAVNILDDYRRAFGKEPPATACLAIMNDSDDARESSRSFIEYIEITSSP